MPQNKSKFIELLISNLSNALVHSILEKSATHFQGLSEKYRKELINSFEIAKRYREKINPINSPLSNIDFSYIKERITKKVKVELQLRINKGYKNINLNSIDGEVDKVLKELNII